MKSVAALEHFTAGLLEEQAPLLHIVNKLNHLLIGYLLGHKFVAQVALQINSFVSIIIW